MIRRFMAQTVWKKFRKRLRIGKGYSDENEEVELVKEKRGIRNSEQ